MKLPALLHVSDPVHTNLYEIRFKSKWLSAKEKDILTSAVMKASYIDNSLEIHFGQLVIDKRVQPIAILEKLYHRTRYNGFKTQLLLHNREGEVTRKLVFRGCRITESSGLEVFDYSLDQNSSLASPLLLFIRFEHIDIKK